jgi:hypothetical protein
MTVSSLSPLPYASPGLPARVVRPQVWSSIPAGRSQNRAQAANPLPAWPSNQSPPPQSYPASWPAPLTALPTAPKTPPQPTPVEIPWPTSASSPAPAHEPLDFTDNDLREALGPIIEHSVRRAVYAQENGIDTYLEPMLRATIRRALAEYSPTSRPFHAPAAYDRFIWHLQALFTSRTYEDILFEKTNRFQVEEVYLLDTSSLALVSFASCDPARHASAKRVTPMVHRIATELRDAKGHVRSAFELPDQRNAIACAGALVNLVAVVRGRPSELILADLEFALRRIEDRFREQFKKEGSPLMLALQPFLEDCLLIQAPASAA